MGLKFVLLGIIQLAILPSEAKEKAQLQKAWRFCPSFGSGFVQNSLKTLENPDREELTKLLGLPGESIKIDEKSSDISDERAIGLVQEALRFRPRSLTSAPLWAEGTQFRRGHIIASMKKARIEIADYQVCVMDLKGNHWFFRKVPIDGWK
jgi:hypothetical protein